MKISRSFSISEENFDFIRSKNNPSFVDDLITKTRTEHVDDETPPQNFEEWEKWAKKREAETAEKAQEAEILAAQLKEKQEMIKNKMQREAEVRLLIEERKKALEAKDVAKAAELRNRIIVLGKDLYATKL